MTFAIEDMLDMDEKPMLTDFEITDIAELAELLFLTRATPDIGKVVTVSAMIRIPLALVIYAGLAALVDNTEELV